MKEQFTRVRKEQLLPPNNARPINPDRIKSMIPDIRQHGGPFQPPGAVKLKDLLYRIVWGHTRSEATWQAGLEELTIRVLPEGTTEADELKYSLIENHDRTAEDFEVVLERVSAFAAKANISMKEAAAFAKVAPSVLSRWQRCSQKLSPEVKALAKTEKVGLSVLYLLTKVADHPRQLELLSRYIAGALSRDMLGLAVKPSKAVNASSERNVNFGFAHNKVGCKIHLPEDSSYETLLHALAELKSQISRFQKQNIPVRLLPEMLAETHIGADSK